VEQKASEKILPTCFDKSKLFIIARPKQIDTANAHFIGANVTLVTICPAMLPEVIDGIVYCPESITLHPSD
jgi:hypothetical protein